MPASPGADELDDVVAFIAGQQAQADRRVCAVGTDAAGIVAELEGLRPSWTATARVLRDGAGITGALVMEWDEDLGRAWIVGPWVVGEGGAWAAAANALVDAGLKQLPPTVMRHEACGDIANRRLADLAASRGWIATEASQVLIADVAVAATWPAAVAATMPVVRAAGPDDVDHIAALHDTEFPDTYASAARLVEGQLDGSAVVLVAGDGRGGLVGYAAGEVHDDGEGFIDFVAVDPAARRTGVGRQLVVAITRALLDRSALGRVGLTVQDHRRPARMLYERLGFRPGGSLVGYRSWGS